MIKTSELMHYWEIQISDRSWTPKMNPLLLTIISSCGTVISMVAVFFNPLLKGVLAKQFDYLFAEPLKTRAEEQRLVFQHELAKQLEEFKGQLHKKDEDEGIDRQLRQLEAPALREAERIIHRIGEIFEGKHIAMYKADWSFKELSFEGIESNKCVTTSYRIMRLFGLSNYTYEKPPILFERGRGPG